jgi:hypothetical protein
MHVQRYLQDLLAETAELRALVDELQRENARLHAIEAEHARLLEQQAHVEQQNADLASLYVAAHRLHAALRREDVVAAIHEIITNLVGCEEFAIFDASPDGMVLSPLSWWGVDLDYLCALCLDRGVIDDVATRGGSFVADTLSRARGPRGELPITACVAMKLDGRLTGLIVLFRMLAKKARFEPLDRELLDLLATHAALALYVTRAYAKEAPTMRPPSPAR